MDESACQLDAKQCVPCRGGVEPLRGEAICKLRTQIDPSWSVCDEHHLERIFKFKNFLQALDFTNLIGKLAEAQGHHPEITLTWGKVTVRIWTHKINGLHENDFILAAKIDKTLFESGV